MTRQARMPSHAARTPLRRLPLGRARRLGWGWAGGLALCGLAMCGQAHAQPPEKLPIPSAEVAPTRLESWATAGGLPTPEAGDFTPAFPPADWLLPLFNRPDAGIHRPLLPAPLPPATDLPDALPEAPTEKARALAQANTPVLALVDVLTATDRSFPLLLAIRQQREIASGLRLSAEGAFDVNFRGSNFNVPDGSFQNNQFNVGIDQFTPLWGISYFAGYRISGQDFPSYSGAAVTAEGGEFRGGFLIPLLRDGPIDRRRAVLRKAQIAEQIADPQIQAARIEFLRSAARSYWAWVAAIEIYSVNEELLEVANSRQAALDRLVEGKQGNQVNADDNRRAILERRELLFAAERAVQQTALNLSLFLRDDDGHTMLPRLGQSPRGFLDSRPPGPNVAGLRQDLDLALSLRPELRRFRLERESIDVDQRLAENQNLPAFNVGVAGRRDVGQSPSRTLDAYSCEISVTMDVPLQRRDARGQAITAQGRQLQLAAQEQFARDDVIRAVQDAVSNLELTYKRIEQARAEVEQARKVVAQERRRVEIGQFDFIALNIRELNAAAAQAKLITRLAEYFAAQADYRAALGLDARPPTP